MINIKVAALFAVYMTLSELLNISYYITTSLAAPIVVNIINIAVSQ